MQRGKCSKATLHRRLAALRDAGLLKVVRHSAPGVRAIYEVPVLWITPEQVSAIVRPEHVSPTVRPEQVSTYGVRSHSDPEQVSKPGATGLSVSETHAVIYPVTTTPSKSVSTVDGASVEGGGLSTGDPVGRHRRLNGQQTASRQAAESRELRGAQ